MSSRHGYNWWRQRVYDGLFVALCTALPFIQIFNRWPFVSYLIALLVLTWLLGGRFRARWQSTRTQPVLLLSAAVYIPYLLGLLYSSNMEAGWAAIVLKVPLFIFPILVASEILKTRVIRASLAGFAVATSACLAFAFVRASSGGVTDIKGLTYTFLSTHVNLDPSILAMYAAFGLVCVAFLVLTQRSRSWWMLALAAVMACGLAVSIVLLSSRTGLIVLVMLLVIGVVLLTRERWWFSLVVPVTMVAVGLALPNLYHETFIRVTSVFDESDAPAAEPGSVAFRRVVWKAAVDGIARQPFVGVGTGDAGDWLSVAIADMSPDRIDSQLHAHNQFLQTGLAVGLPAAALLIASLVWPFIVNLRRQRGLYPVFAGMMVVFMVFHCPFEMQSSLIFFAVFNALLMRPITDESVHASG
jgi:O-antigen ligase